jgi:hypothetical protein
MDVPSHAEVVEQIDSFLSRHDMAPSRFGRAALGEPAFVSTLRAGRTPGLGTLAKLFAFMRERDAELERSATAASRSGGRDGAHRLNAGAR